MRKNALLGGEIAQQSINMAPRQRYDGIKICHMTQRWAMVVLRWAKMALRWAKMAPR